MIILSKLCTLGLRQRITSNLLVTNTRNFYNLPNKSGNLFSQLRLFGNNLKKSKLLLKNARQSGQTIALRFSSTECKKSNKIVGSWLLICSGMVFVAVSLGTISYFLTFEVIKNVLLEIIDKTYGK